MTISQSISNLIHNNKTRILIPIISGLVLYGCQRSRSIDVITEESGTHNSIKAKVEFTDYKTNEVYHKMSDGKVTMDLPDGKYLLCILTEDKRVKRYEHINVTDTTKDIVVDFDKK